MTTKREIDQAIVDVYDAHVGIYGYDKNVFQIATVKQVAAHLGIPSYLIAVTLGRNAPYGYAQYKQELLAKRGRGSIVCSGNICWYEPVERPQ